MKSLRIHYAGFFNKKEHFIQEPQHLFLFFQTKGLCRMSAENFVTMDFSPFCFLFFPGDKFEFEFNEKRKNWAVQFSLPDIRYVSSKQFSFSYGTENIILPRYFEPTQGEVVRLQNKFEALIASFMNPTPHERMLAQLYLLDIFKYYIESLSKAGQTSPAAKLKQLMDTPVNMSFSIAELSEKCGYSIDHLRVLFKNKYGISPQEYQIRHVMAYAMELICKSNLMVSDIAEKCNFKHLSHFSSLFKKTHGISPSAALKRFRYR